MKKNEVIRCPKCGGMVTSDKKPGHYCFRRHLDEIDIYLRLMENAEHVRHRRVFMSMLGF